MASLVNEVKFLLASLISTMDAPKQKDKRASEVAQRMLKNRENPPQQEGILDTSIKPKDGDDYRTLARKLEIDQLHAVRFKDGTMMNRTELYLKAIELDPMHANSYLELATLLKEEKIRLNDGTFLTKQQLYLRAITLCPEKEVKSLACYYRLLALSLSPSQKVQMPNGETKTGRELCLIAMDLCPQDFGMAVPILYDLLTDGETIVLPDGSNLTRQGETMHITECSAFAMLSWANKLDDNGVHTFSNGKKMTKQQLGLMASKLDPKRATLYLQETMRPGDVLIFPNGRALLKDREVIHNGFLKI